MTVQVQLEQIKPEQIEPDLVWKSNDELSCLYHGDSLKLMALLPAESVDCIWTDPPYRTHLASFIMVK